MVSDAPGCMCVLCGGPAEVRMVCACGCSAWWECVQCQIDGTVEA